VLARLADAVAGCLADPAVRARYAESGVEPLAGGPAEARRFLRSEMETWLPILRATGARPG
jgi:tripartite-type tricarboxylate transporter receptor subunit TctC